MLNPTAQLPHRTPAPRCDLQAPVVATDHRRGAHEAQTTIVEYGDFECLACRVAEPAVRMILAAHPGTVQLVYRHYPMESMHPLAVMAAEASEAAAAQGRFWGMHDLLLRQGAPLDRAALERAAWDLNLDLQLFNAALRDEIYRQRIREQVDGAIRSRVREMPGFFVNGKVCDISGGMHELANAVLDAETHGAARSGIPPKPPSGRLDVT